MAYTALYRKFRPDTFQGVIGQEHIVTTLKNQIASGRVSHAYLFCGTRGTGKTSTAKIFAKAINCLNLEDGEPCGKCSLCVSMQANRSVNVIEIDAASNNGVDNIREIREEVKYPPTEGSFKVYIIDEVHMLSTGAFNALLKTLEEPPEHVIFILATTDPQKVPATIHSRCQRFDFKRITSGAIVKTLKGYLAQDGGTVEDKALHYIATLADGSMRDSLSILDQCLAFYFNQEITLEKVLEVVGAVDTTVFFNTTEALLNKDATKAMDIVEEIMSAGRDVAQFVSEFIVHLRNLLLTITVDEPETVMDLSQEMVERLGQQGKKMSAPELIYLIKEFSQLGGQIKYASNRRILLEVALIKICSPSQEKDIDSLVARLYGLERKVEEGIKVVQVQGEQTTPEKKEQPKKQRPKALPEDIKEASKQWKDVAESLDTVTKSLMDATQTGYMEDGRLAVVCPTQTVVELLKKKVEPIQGACLKIFKKEFEIRFISKEEYNAWERLTYGSETKEAKKEMKEDEEFASLMGGYFPQDELI